MEGANITIAIAFVAGLASFLTPCVLPLVPGYISLISGVSIDHLKTEQGSVSSIRRAVILNSLAFNAGLSLIFVSIGAAAGWAGASITSNPWVRIIGGVIIILFGIHLTGLFTIRSLYKDTRFFSSDKPTGMLGSFTLGMAFAAGWTPCIGPILGMILGLAATSGGWKSGFILLAFYSAGLAIPFLLTGLGINQFLSFYKHFRRHLHKVEVVSGIILIFIGFMIAFNYTASLPSSRLARVLPNFEAWVGRVMKVDTSTNATSPNAAIALAPAPDVQMNSLTGDPIRLSDLKGKVVILNFWATWCVPCLEEIPAFNDLYRELKDKGIEIVGLSWNDSPEQIVEFEKDIPIDYKITFGGEELQSKFGGVPSLPTTYIIDKNGFIREKITGARDKARFEASVRPLL
jgi:cytochrome c-type biogenesis protein